MTMSDYWNKENLVLGCGNVLFGDDGFGPEVVEYFEQNYEIPPGVGVINAGLSVREILFNITLSDRRPRRIIIVDAVDVGKEPGEVFELDIDGIPEQKLDDFSMHQLPTTNLLKEIQSMGGVEVKIIAVQIQDIPEEVAPGLSEAVADAIPVVCESIMCALQ